VQQYHVAEIHLEGVPVEDETEADEGQIRAAHVLYSPGDDPAGAGDLPDDDPEWEEAEEAARAAYDALSAIDDVEERKEAFAARAEAESDDQGSGATGGDLGWFTRGDMVAAFADPLFDGEDLVSGDILEPVKSDFGWHVILFEDRRAPVDDRLADVQERLAAGDPFADVAREYSDGDEAADGGALGWLIAEQLPGEAEGVIQELDPGEVSEPLFVDDDGYHIYQLIEEAERELNAEQRSLLRGGAYDTWYTERKEQAEADGRITRDESIFGGGSVVDPAEGVEAPEDAVP
jgi:parvulin-like peptidyl-prolyl isomerase